MYLWKPEAVWTARAPGATHPRVSYRPGPAATHLFSLASGVMHGLSRRPFMGTLSGGAALRAGYGKGLFRYRVLRLRKAAA